MQYIKLNVFINSDMFEKIIFWEVNSIADSFRSNPNLYVYIFICLLTCMCVYRSNKIYLNQITAEIQHYQYFDFGFYQN